MFWPCETRTSICRNLATISSGLYRFLAITVLLDVKNIPQVGPLQWGPITHRTRFASDGTLHAIAASNLLCLGQSQTYVRAALSLGAQKWTERLSLLQRPQPT